MRNFRITGSTLGCGERRAAEQSGFYSRGHLLLRLGLPAPRRALRGVVRLWGDGVPGADCRLPVAFRGVRPGIFLLDGIGVDRALDGFDRRDGPGACEISLFGDRRHLGSIRIARRVHSAQIARLTVIGFLCSKVRKATWPRPEKSRSPAFTRVFVPPFASAISAHFSRGFSHRRRNNFALNRLQCSENLGIGNNRISATISRESPEKQVPQLYSETCVPMQSCERV